MLNFPATVVSFSLTLWAVAPVTAQHVGASSANDYDARREYERQARQPRPAPTPYTPPPATTTSALPSGNGTSPDMAGHYRQAAQQSRDAAARTKCPENKRYYTAMAQYCDCLADQLRSNSTLTCTQPTGQPVDCPQDVALVNPSTGKADFSQLTDAFANLDLSDAEASLKTLKTQICQMRDELASESNPDASTRNLLSSLTDMLSTSNLTQFVTKLQQFIEQAANDN